MDERPRKIADGSKWLLTALIFLIAFVGLNGIYQVMADLNRREQAAAHLQLLIDIQREYRRIDQLKDVIVEQQRKTAKQTNEQQLRVFKTHHEDVVKRLDRIEKQLKEQ